jgi:hypothetical protein
MNLNQANEILEQTQNLHQEIKNRLPQTISIKKYNDQQKFTLKDVDLNELTVEYYCYIGCGEYEYITKDIYLKDLFSNEEENIMK